MVSDRFGAHSIAKTSRMEGLEAKWEHIFKQQQNEAHTLCHHAIHNLIPMAGAYELSMLDAVSQASSIYAPDQVEAIYQEGNKKVEDIAGHISGILYNARKMREASRETNKTQDMHMKAVMYHNSVMPYIDTLRFHIDRLKEMMGC